MNSHGDSLIEFLLSSSMCTVNGRSAKDNYTCITPNGASVVDYCLVPYEKLSIIQDFTVTTPGDLLTQSNCAGIVDPTRTLSDHNMLKWSILLNLETDVEIQIKSVPEVPSAKIIKFDLNLIPTEFMCDPEALNTINNIVNKVANSAFTQEACDQLYGDFVELVWGEMIKKIPYREIELCDKGANAKKRQRTKPWWSAELSVMWDQYRKAEKLWLSDKANHERKLAYLCKRKEFDKSVQGCKRAYWYNKQNEILEAHGNPHEFWTMVNRKSSIPMEIIEDGVVVSDINKVLQKWKDDFRNLYNQNIVVNDVEAISDVRHDVVDTSQINDDITRSQVGNALKMAKQGKATGTDKLPVEVLCNPTCTRFLHIFFQKCFKNALVPLAFELWKHYGSYFECLCSCGDKKA